MSDQVSSGYVDPQGYYSTSSSFIVIVTDGQSTLSSICSTYGVSREKLISINTQKIDTYYLPLGFKFNSGVRSVRDYLTRQYQDHQPVVRGLELRIPRAVSGGKSETDIAVTYNYETLAELADQSVGSPLGEDNFSKLANTNDMKVVGEDNFSKLANTNNMKIARFRKENGLKVLPSTWSNFHGERIKNAELITTDSLSKSKFGCYFYVLSNGSIKSSSLSKKRKIKGQSLKVVPLPVYPQEFSDSNSATFSSVSMLGRSVDYQIYNGSGRSVSFTLNFHQELVPGNDEYVRQVVSEIESACYPNYQSGVVRPPEIAFVIGPHFYIRGILESASATWKAPIIDGYLVNCDLSVSVKETNGPYSMDEVAKMKGFRF